MPRVSPLGVSTRGACTRVSSERSCGHAASFFDRPAERQRRAHTCPSIGFETRNYADQTPGLQASGTDYMSARSALARVFSNLPPCRPSLICSPSSRALSLRLNNATRVRSFFSREKRHSNMTSRSLYLHKHYASLTKCTAMFWEHYTRTFAGSVCTFAGSAVHADSAAVYRAIPVQRAAHLGDRTDT